MKKTDIIIFIIIIAAAAVLYFSGLLKPGGKGDFVRITVNGSDYKTLDLNKNHELVIENNGHINKLVIENGFADMIEADCPDKICVKHKKISKSGETITCLPNKVVIEIKSKNNEIDSVAQ